MSGPGRKLAAEWRGTFQDVWARRLVIMSLIDSLGTGLYIAGSAIYFTRAAGLSSGRVGLGLAIASVAGLIGVVPVGWVADRIGTWQTLLGLDLWRMVGFTGYVFVHSFGPFLFLMCFLGIAEQAVNPLMQRLAEQIAGPHQRTVMMAKLRTVYNVGFTLGAPLSGVAVAFGTRTALNTIMLGDAFSYVLAAVLLYHVRGAPGLAGKPGRAAGAAGWRRFSLEPLRDRRYLSAAAVNSVLSLHMSVLSLGIPLWISLHTSVPRAAVGPLLAINTALVIALQVPVSARADSVLASVSLMRAAGVALAGSCLLLALARELPVVPALAVLASAVVLLTVSEMTQSAAGWTLAYELAPTPERAQCLATFGLSTSAQFVFGPLLLTDVVMANGPLGWVALGGGLLACSLLVSSVIQPGQEKTGSTAADVS